MSLFFFFFWKFRNISCRACQGKLVLIMASFISRIANFVRYNSKLLGNKLPVKLKHYVKTNQVRFIFRQFILKIDITSTEWKVSKCGVSYGLHFLAIGINTGKYGPEKNRYFDTFHAVERYNSCLKESTFNTVYIRDSDKAKIFKIKNFSFMFYKLDRWFIKHKKSRFWKQGGHFGNHLK